MHKQYYFTPQAEAFDAWDVGHLIELSEDLPVMEVPLSDIAEIDTVYWFGADGAPATVRILVRHMELMSQADLSYPVIPGADGQVMDGMHRIAKSLLLGRSSVRAVRFSKQPPPDHTNVMPDDLACD
jgi:hypothetical protein